MKEPQPRSQETSLNRQTHSDSNAASTSNNQPNPDSNPKGNSGTKTDSNDVLNFNLDDYDWQDVKSKAASLERHVIVTTSTSQHNCLGSAVGETLMLTALHGHEAEKAFLQSGRFKSLLTKLNVNSFKELSESETLTTTSGRQEAFGGVFRDFIAELLYKDNNEATTVLFNTLSADFRAYVDNSSCRSNDIFAKMGFVVTQFAALKQKHTPQEGQEKVSKSLLNELKTWWDSEGYNLYIAEIRKPKVFLGGTQLAVFAKHFGLNLRYLRLGAEQWTNDENSDDAVFKGPTISLHYNGSNHWSAYVPSHHFEAFNNDKEKPTRKMHVDHALSAEDKRVRDHLRQEKRQKQREKDLQHVSSLTRTVNSEEFFTQVSNLFNDKSENTESPKDSKKALIEVRDFFSSYDPDKRVLSAINGVELTISTQTPKMEEEPSESNELFVQPRYTKPKDGDDLDEVGIKKAKLDGIARAFAATFIANGMEEDKLQINLKKLGLWGEESDKAEIERAFRAADFQRVEINGVELYDTVKERYEAEDNREKEQGKKAKDESMAGKPVVLSEETFYEKAEHTLKGVVSKYPIESAAFGSTALLSLGVLYGSGNLYSSTVNPITMASLALLSFYEAIEHRRAIQSTLIQGASVLARQWMMLIGSAIAYNSAGLYHPMTLMTIQGVVSGLANDVLNGYLPTPGKGAPPIQGNRELTLDEVNRLEEKEKYSLGISKVTTIYLACSAVKTGNYQAFAMTVGINGLAWAGNYLGSKVSNILGSENIFSTVGDQVKNRWNAMITPYRYVAATMTLLGSAALHFYFGGGKGLFFMGAMQAFQMTQNYQSRMAGNLPIGFKDYIDAYAKRENRATQKIKENSPEFTPEVLLSMGAGGLLLGATEKVVRYSAESLTGLPNSIRSSLSASIKEQTWGEYFSSWMPSWPSWGSNSTVSESEVVIPTTDYDVSSPCLPTPEFNANGFVTDTVNTANGTQVIYDNGVQSSLLRPIPSRVSNQHTLFKDNMKTISNTLSQERLQKLVEEATKKSQL